MKTHVIFYAVLNWGLGHATRSVRVIEHLMARNCRVIIGGSGNSLAYLRHRFPDNDCYETPRYDITYRSGKAWMDITTQLPKINRAIIKEHHWIRDFASQNQVDAIISDNCYGMHLDGLPSILLTHQLTLKAPVALKFLAQKKLASHLRNFDEVWIPDIDSTSRLAGSLSDIPDNINARYIGVLSRLNPPREPVERKPNSVLGLVSGPETQRTTFEGQLLNILKNHTGECTVLCGLPNESFNFMDGPVQKVSHLGDVALAHAMLRAETIICRSGYSTIMDLACLNRSAILIATPGQHEQEYLADYHEKTGLYRSCKVEELEKMLEHPAKDAAEFQNHGHLLDEAIDSLIEQLETST